MAASRRRIEASICRFIPSSLEMEEFFAAAEQQGQHTFREKCVSYSCVCAFNI
jgi:hypothetical protein